MNAEKLKNRTKQLSIRIVRLFRSLPKTEEARVIGRQLLRSATSVAANYRAACRARSSSEFVAKMGIVEEEADETLFWLEILAETKIVNEALLKDLIIEYDEIVAIVVSSKKTARRKT